MKFTFETVERIPPLCPVSTLLTEEPPLSLVLGQAPLVRAEAC